MKAYSLAFCLVLLLVSAAQADDSLNVRLVGSCATPGKAYGVVVNGNYAFVADWSSGLRVISVADPAHPTEVGHTDTPDSAVGVAVSGNYVYVVGIQSGLRVISVADPANPTEVGYYNTPGKAYGVAINGNYAYVADVDSGLWVISIADPAHPTEVGHLDLQMAMALKATGHFVYVADYLGGLRVISVANPANPVEVGHNDSLGFACLAVNGDHIYLDSDEDGLFVVSAIDSTHPSEVGWCNTHEWVTHIAVGNYAYTIGSSRLYVVSVTDPANPDTVGHYNKSSWGANDLAASGDDIYVATNSGLSVCQRYDAGVEEVPNGDTRAAKCEPTVVRGVLFLAEAASLKPQAARLLDISGRRVMDLHPGANDVSGLIPGVYFAKGTNAEQSAVTIRKVIIAR